MFFIKHLERTMTLHPSFFGSHVRQYLTAKLHEEMEGNMIDNYYIICVIDIQTIPEGRVVPGTGYAEYNIKFRGVVWKPFKGEVMDGFVESVLSSGFTVQVGPLLAFIPKQLVHPGMKFDGNATPPQWTDNGDNVVEKGSQVRFRINGLRFELKDMFAIGTIRQAFGSGILSILGLGALESIGTLINGGMIIRPIHIKQVVWEM